MNANGLGSKGVPAREVMIKYLMLPPDERVEFDRFYGKREIMIEIHDLLKRARPEQLKRVQERVATWNSKGAGGKGL